MREFLKRSDILRQLYYSVRLRSAKAQSDEVQIINRLAAHCPKTFVEFGFGPVEFNCLDLAKSRDWQGLLIDGDGQRVSDAKLLFPHVNIARKFLTLDNLDFIGREFKELGVLSIDVDGNDYWFLEKLISIRPSVICVEYNSTFGLDPISVPYDPNFDRHEKHPKGWYHGASLTALASLCHRNGYGLAAVSHGGGNAFFTTDGSLDPAKEWRPNILREQYSGADRERQWEAVCSLPFVRV